MDQRLVFRINGGVLAPTQARQIVEASAEGKLAASLLGALKLLVSEVVANSVRHGGAGADDVIELGLTLNAEWVRVDVLDRGPGFRVMEEPSTGNESGGWGLYLVKELAQRWGVDCSDATHVWFELGPEADLVAA